MTLTSHKQPKERPIIFSEPMVNAILAGQKTMTRRVVKAEVGHYQKADIIRQSSSDKQLGCAYFFDGEQGGYIDSSQLVKCPFGRVGDHLWVRETWQQVGSSSYLTYKATYPNDLFERVPGLENVPSIEELKDNGYHWKSPIFMPREFSRIVLKITDIQVERLQDITEADAIKEGFGSRLLRDCKVPKFKNLWDSLYDENSPKRWANNPWVWVVTFERIY